MALCQLSDEAAYDLFRRLRWPDTDGFRVTYPAGFFVVAAQDMLGRTGVSPTGLNWTALVADLQKV